MKRRIAHLPLHGGKTPPWLFKRMSKLAGAVTMAVVDEYGPEEMLRRLSDPWWFQAFGCVLGFDWHSSGVTTVTCGALKEAYKRCGADLGIVVAGGKGGTSRKTPDEIARAADQYGITAGDRLVHASRMSAKVDSSAVQDGFQVYHHSFFLTPSGSWCVVQQGMDEQAGMARRYHWLGESVDDFVCEPHAAVGNLSSANNQTPPVKDALNMVAREAAGNRDASAELARAHPDWLMEQVIASTEGPTLFAPQRHRLLDLDVNMARLRRVVISAYEAQPDNFAGLLELPGVGPTTVRALALLAELIYQAPTSQRDPVTDPDGPRWADYAYAHGGKDGTPFPVDRETYDRSIAVLTEAVRRARIGDNERVEALRRLSDSGNRA